MVLIALLSARAAVRDGSPAGLPPALLDFGGQPLIEYQARLALAAGARKLLIQADALHADASLPELTRLADNVAHDGGYPVSLVRDMTELARALGPDDHVLLLAEGIVLPGEALDALLEDGLEHGDEAILALPSVASTAAFERIDAGAMWGGALLISGARILSTLDMLGDWDLMLTLLRRAVQDDVPRVMLPPELVTQGRLAFLTDQASADIALEVLSDYGPETEGEQADGISALLAPLSRVMLREAMHRQVEPGRLAVLAFALAAGALAFALSAWTLPALIIMLPALGLTALSERYARLTLRASGRRWQYPLVQAGALLLLAIIGVRIAAPDPLALAGAGFPLLFIALFTFAEARSAPVARWQAQFLPGVAGALLLVLAGSILGLTAAAFAVMGVLVAGIVALRLFQPDSGGI